ncbi:MAG: hypothetical protein LIQ31_08655 [Planctomycetes bacterium]|nr:hypothetical protein [Planctomycetota bacterium]
MSTDNKPHVPKIDESKPVVWTPEDASRFLTSAIHEAQRPLAEALKQRPITARALTVMVAIIIVAALIIALILSNQLEKAEKRAELNQAARDTLLAERHEINAKATTLEDRLNNAIAEQRELASTIDSLKVNEEVFKKTQADLARFRRQAELLRSQISGLEMEKAAIARQLEAIKALAMEDGEGLADDATPFDEYSQDAPIISTPLTAYDADSGLFIIPESLPAEPAETPADGPAPVQTIPAPEATREMVDEAAESVEPVAADEATPPAPEEAVVAEPVTTEVAPAAEAEPTVAEPAAEAVVEPVAEPVAEPSVLEPATAEAVETPAESEPTAEPVAEPEPPVTDDAKVPAAAPAAPAAPAEPEAAAATDDGVDTFEDHIPTTTPTMTPESEVAPAAESEAAPVEAIVEETAVVVDETPVETANDSSAATVSQDVSESTDSAEVVEGEEVADTPETVESADTFTATASRYGDETAAPAEDVVEDTAVASDDAAPTSETASDVGILDEAVIGVILDREADSSTSGELDRSATGTPMGENVPVIP